MAGEFTATLDATEWETFLKVVDGKLKNPNPMLTAAYSTVGHADILRHFRAQVGPSGPWQERHLTTQLRDAKVYSGKWQPWPGTRRSWYQPDRPLLTFSGKMRQALLTGQKSVRNLGHGVVEAFNRMAYSGKHDRGEGVPRREFMWFSKDAMDRMAQALLHFVTGGK